MPDDLLLIAILVMLIVGIGFGLYSRRGSGIEEHPDSGRAGPRPPR